ncbi:outer membrane beta-barrel protein [Candidatus Ferrigenium straubiae]|uniref:outer membrane beta-barrel protein n=1 Tax=Candidatus Ferrigenium straubiae TaxID=2919506 RepID=UPI003F4A91E3
MKKVLAGLCVAATMATVSGVALATDEGFYVLGSVGQTRVSYPQAATDAALTNAGAVGVVSTASNNPTAFKLQAGYQINQNFAVEGGYIDLGKISYSATGTVGGVAGTATETDKAEAWNISAVGILPFGNSFSAIGKLGVASVRSNANAAVTLAGIGTATLGASKSKTDLTYGLGIKYDISKNFAVRGDWDRYNTGVTGTGNISVLSLGVAYKF